MAAVILDHDFIPGVVRPTCISWGWAKPRTAARDPAGAEDAVVVAMGGGVAWADLSGSLLAVMLAGEHRLIGGPAVKKCSLRLVSAGPSAQTPYLSYLGVYPLPPNNSKPGAEAQNPAKVPRRNEGWGKREKQGRGRERERVTCAQWELTKHLVIKSKLTFW